jgi:hypothetical protein
MKKLALALLILLLAPLAAAAQIIGSYPYTFTNGTLADANQVMSNFNYITTQVNANVCATGGCTFTGGIFGTTATFSGALSAGAISGTTGTFSSTVLGAGLVINEASSWAGAQAEAKSTQWALSGYSTATTGYGAGILRIDNTGSNLLAMYYGASTQVGYFYTDGTNLKLGTPTFYLSGALSAGGAISGSTGTFSSTGTFYGQAAATVQASSSDPGHAGGIIYTSGACPTLTTGAICFQTN